MNKNSKQFIIILICCIIILTYSKKYSEKKKSIKGSGVTRSLLSGSLWTSVWSSFSCFCIFCCFVSYLSLIGVSSGVFCFINYLTRGLFYSEKSLDACLNDHNLFNLSLNTIIGIILNISIIIITIILPFYIIQYLTSSKKKKSDKKVRINP